MVSRSVAAVLLAATVVTCGARALDVSSEPPAPKTTADYYGEYQVSLGGAGETAEGSEMIGRWTASGFVVSQTGTELIRTQMALTADGTGFLIWDELSSDPTCSAEGLYGIREDGGVITLSLVGDDCEGRRQSANGARLTRLD